MGTRMSRRISGSRQQPQLSGLARLTDQNAYSGQQRVILWLEAMPSLLSTVITTGLVSNAYQIVASNVVSFAARFGSTYDEFRILRARFKIRPVSPSATGVSVFMFDEKSSGAPTLVDAQERNGLRLPNSGSNSAAVRTMVFTTSDIGDLDYAATSSISTVLATFKTYTDAANFGSPATVTPLWLVEPAFEIEFRGIKAV